MRTTAGCLFMGKEKYKKPRLSIDEQIQLLEQQGLKIENVQDAKHIIRVVGYYRFSGYLHPFKSRICQDFGCIPSLNLLETLSCDGA